MQHQIVAPEVRDLEILSGQLAEWLASKLPHASEIRLSNLTYPNGAGQSHETILFDAAWSEGGRRQDGGLVVRIKPMRHTVFPDDLFEQQYRVMRTIHAGGWARVAETLWYEEDPALLGAPFFVMRRLRGRVAVSIPPYAQTGWVADATPAQRRRLWENGVRALASVQKVPVSEVGFLAGSGAAHSGLDQEWDKYLRFVEWVSQERRWGPIDEAVAKLKSRWPKHQPPGLVWGDARLGNIMFDENLEELALMDWEQPSLGGALHDLAWWVSLAEIMHGEQPGRPHLAGMGTREETIALWREATGIPTDDIEWYEDFTQLKIACTSVRMGVLKNWPTPDDETLRSRLRFRTDA
jgi:aminoglycoside phosphotransferase (APT) family kinase protein